MLTDVITCVNCGDPLDKEGRLFCSVRCREQASLVRFVRKRGWDAFNGEDELMAEAFDHKLRSALRDGYRAFHVVTDDTRAKVLERDQKKCVQCGSEENLQVDHIEHLEDFEAFNAAANLQVLCQTCHRKKTLESLIEVELDEDQQSTYQMLLERIDSPNPLKLCDDPDGWDAFRRKPYRDIFRTMFEMGWDVDTVRRSLSKAVAQEAARNAQKPSLV